MEHLYYQNEAGSLIKGIGLPAFIHNGGYYQVLIGIYEDGLVDCWDMVTLEEFKAKVRSGWVVTEVPKGAPISCHHLYQGKCDVEFYVKPEEFIKEVEDVMGRFKGVPTSSERCLAAFRNYLFSPGDAARETLRQAYMAVPEHLRDYLLGDMDSRDAPIRRIIGEWAPRPLEEGDIEQWKERYFRNEKGPTSRCTE